jgi:hypothetical protein
LLKKKCILTISIICLTSLWSGVNYAVPEKLKSKPKDIRVIIDVSDGMVVNDPQNMRAAGVKIFSRLLPYGATAGVWTFDGSTYSLVPLGIVSKQWVDNAVEASSRIHSNGQMSNIVSALNMASLGWTEPNYDDVRNIILLADGFIKVSVEQPKNDESRANLLQTMLPKFKDLGIRINTIALSGEADVDLLQKMATQTDGYFCQVNTASELQKAFLKILDFNIVPDGIPIEENKFTIDKHIKEVTLVLYSKTVASNANKGFVKLKAPDGSSYDSENIPKNMLWYQEGYINVINIKDPQIGDWLFVGAIDLDKRAYVLSDIDLSLKSIPGNVFVGEKIYLSAMLTEKNKVMVNSPLADMTHVTATINPGTKQQQIFIYVDAALENGSLQNGSVYSLYLPIPKVDNSDLIIQTTFTAYPLVRQKQQRLRVLPTPVDLRVSAAVDAAGQKVMTIQVVADKNLISEDSLVATINIEDNAGKKLEYNMHKDANGQRKLLLSPDPGISSYSMVLDLAAKTLQGRDIVITTAPVRITVPQVTLPEPKIITIEPAKDEKKITEEALAAQEQLSMGKIIIYVTMFMLINIMLLSIIYVFTKLISKMRDEKIKIIAKDIR